MPCPLRAGGLAFSAGEKIERREENDD